MIIDKRLGYYTCAGIEFESKIQASFHSIKTSQPVEWHFNDEVFSRHHWREPIETLDQLYDRRCKEIREKYDYVILSYSGGADSHNILASFVRQGLRIDEIIVNTMEKANSKFTVIDRRDLRSENAAAEYHLQTLPRLKELADKIPGTKITVCDLSDHLFDYMNSAKDASWVLARKEGLNPANVTRFNYLHISDVRKQFDKSKSLVLIVGVDKPRIFIKDNYIHTRFGDRAANIVPVPEHLTEYTNTTVDLFYWSPYSLDIITKQAYVVRAWLLMNPQYINLFQHDVMHRDPKIYRLCHEKLLRTIIYTTWDANWYQADKAVKDWTSEFDSWFIENYSDTSAHKIWTAGINYVKNNLRPLVKETDGELDGLTLFGKNYQVCKFKDNP
jgi:hypothetical protein